MTETTLQRAANVAFRIEQHLTSSRARSYDAFIFEYLTRVRAVSAVDQNFHDEFFERFDGARVEYLFGAMPVHKAQRRLKELMDLGLLERQTEGLEQGPDFPKWVYMYFLPRALDDALFQTTLRDLKAEYEE